MPDTQNIWQELEVAILPFDDCSINSYGLSLILSNILERSGIPHHLVAGCVIDESTGSIEAGHTWICLEDGFIIDIRLRKLFGYDDSVPHGIFVTSQYPGFLYWGCNIAKEPLSDDEMRECAEGIIPDINLEAAFCWINLGIGYCAARAQ